MAHTSFEDTYMTILDVDGPEWADFLRYRMNDKINERLTTEQTWLLTSDERFADLMVGNTVYKREKEAQATHEREQAQNIAGASGKQKKNKEKGKLKLSIKNPLRSSSPKHGSTYQ
jgi:hypothetical protein